MAEGHEEPIAMLSVRAEGAHDLRRTKLLGSQHPYLSLWVTSTRYGQKQETKPDKHGDISATWTETFTFPIFEKREFLFTEVMAKKTLGEPSSVGNGEILITEISTQWQRKSIQIHKNAKDAGEVYLHLKLEILKPAVWSELDEDVLQPLQPVSPKRDNEVKIVRRSTSPMTKNFATSPRNVEESSVSPRAKTFDDATRIEENKLSQADRPRYSALSTMGFETAAILKALKETQTADEAIQWLLEQHDQSAIAPVPVETVSQTSPSMQFRPGVPVASTENAGHSSHEINVTRIIEMGFSQEIAFAAVAQFDTMEEALPWLLTQPLHSSTTTDNQRLQDFNNYEDFETPTHIEQPTEKKYLITMNVPLPQNFNVGQTLLATSLTGEKVSIKIPEGSVPGMSLEVQFYSKYPPKAHMPIGISPSAPPEF